MNNQNSIGAVLLLLLVLAALDGGGSGLVSGSAAASGAGANGKPGAWDGLPPGALLPGRNSGGGTNGRPPFRPPHPAALAKDFHRMVAVMGKVDNLGQMALKPPPAPKPPKASQPESLINASALPDLSGIMDMLGPIMSGLGGASDE